MSTSDLYTAPASQDSGVASLPPLTHCLAALALACFVAALPLPAARVEMDWLDGPISNELQTGWKLFCVTLFSFVLFPLLPFFLSNFCLIYFRIVLFFRPNPEKLPWRLGLLLLAALLAGFETCTNGRMIGHHLWVSSFVIAAIAHVTAIVDTMARSPKNLDEQKFEETLQDSNPTSD